MSFGTDARKVRDPALPYGRRINALGNCVQSYRPLGYQVTFAYLRTVAGPFRKDESALLRAVGVLSASRDLWLSTVRAYAERRTEAKRLGARSPRPGEPNPVFPSEWYGDARAAALFALDFLVRRPPAMADPQVLRLARACADSGGQLAAADREELRRLRSVFHEMRESSGWPAVDWTALAVAGDSLGVLRHIGPASGAA